MENSQEIFNRKKSVVKNLIAQNELLKGVGIYGSTSDSERFSHILVVPRKDSQDKILKKVLNGHIEKETDGNGFLVNLKDIKIPKETPTPTISKVVGKNSSLKNYLERCNKVLSLLGFVIKDGSREIICIYPDSGTVQAARRALVNQGFADSATPLPGNKVKFTILEKRKVTAKNPDYKLWVEQNESPQFRIEIINFVLMHLFKMKEVIADVETGCTKRIVFQDAADFRKAELIFQQLGFRVLFTENIADTKLKYSLHISLLKQVDDFKSTDNASGNTILSEIKRAGGMIHYFNSDLKPNLISKKQEERKDAAEETVIDMKYIGKMIGKAFKGKMGIIQCQKKTTSDNQVYWYFYSKEKNLLNKESISKLIPQEIKPYTTKVTNNSIYIELIAKEEISSSRKKETPEEKSIDTVSKNVEILSKESENTSTILDVDIENISFVAQPVSKKPLFPVVAEELENLDLCFDEEQYLEMFASMPKELRRKIAIKELFGDTKKNTYSLVDQRDPVARLTISVGSKLMELEPRQYNLILKTIDR